MSCPSSRMHARMLGRHFGYLWKLPKGSSTTTDKLRSWVDVFPPNDNVIRTKAQIAKRSRVMMSDGPVEHKIEMKRLGDTQGLGEGSVEKWDASLWHATMFQTNRDSRTRDKPRGFQHYESPWWWRVQSWCWVCPWPHWPLRTMDISAYYRYFIPSPISMICRAPLQEWSI